MTVIERLQGLIGYLAEAKDDDEGCELGIDEVESIIKDLEIAISDLKEV